MGHCAFAHAVREKMVVNVMVFLLISNTNISHDVSISSLMYSLKTRIWIMEGLMLIVIDWTTVTRADT